MLNRRSVRFGTKVIHRHQVGEDTLRRVSELVFVRNQPKAVLDWIDMGGDRMPVYLQLDGSRLHQAKGTKGLFFYDGVTTDPRLDEIIAAPQPARGRR